MSYDINAMREKVRKQIQRRSSDPDEFKPPKLKPGEEAQYRFFVLGPYNKDDQLKQGPASSDLESGFFMNFGQHFGVCKPPLVCPRIYSGSECKFCDHAFELYKAAGDDKDAKSLIRNDWMPAQYYVVNIYFPPGNKNPPDLENKVMYYKAPKTVLDIWFKALENTGPGDNADPQAYGGFFDERSAFMFQLVVKFKGQNNSYENSKFLSNGGVPMAMSDDNGIEMILAARHDLAVKLEKPDQLALTRHFDVVVNGSDNGFSSVIEESSPAPVAAAPVAVAPVAVAPVAAAPVAAAPVTPVAAAPVAAAPVTPVVAAPVAITDDSGGDDVMDEIELMMKQFNG